MKIIVDAFGGDNAPLEIIKGCAEAVAEFDDLSIILTGDEGKILKVAQDNNISLDRIEFITAQKLLLWTTMPMRFLNQRKTAQWL